MIVRSINSANKVICPDGQFVSNRFLTEKDGVGFTITKTIVEKGVNKIWFYKNHLEACYCIKGKGVLIDIETGNKFEIKRDVMYALNFHEKHQLHVSQKMILICIFNPPLKGNEIHNKDGIYE